MKCVKCGRTMVVRTGKSGKFYGCPSYPQCKSTAPYKEVRTPQVRVQRDWSKFQLDIFDAVGRYDDNLLVEATAGSGKCLGKDTPVLMFDGSIKPVQDVSVGDMLMGDDSTPRTVLSTTVGNGELYKITPVKGDPFICNDVHVLSLSGTNKHMGEVIDIPLNKTTDRTHRDWKLYRVGVEFPYKPVPIDPYVVGVWLGDGSFDSQLVCNPEPEILEYMKEYAKSIGGMTSVAERVGDEENGLKYISIIFGKHQFNSNPFRTYILNSCRNGRDKIVPEELKINSREVRLSVLAGLLDTDGYYSHKHYTIVTKYTTLRDDVSFIARSLGFSAYWSERKVRLPDWDEPRTYYSVSISGDLSEIPCLVPRKKAESRNQIKRTTVTGWKKESVGEGDYYGFTLDGNGRFLLGGITVTHNTSTSVEALNYATRYQKIAFVAFNRSIAQDFKDKVPDGVHASTYHALGLKSIMQARGNEVKVEETKNFKLFTKFTDSLADTFKSTATDYRSEILRLVGLAKNVMLDVTGTESFRNLADEYGIDIGDDTESGLVLDLTHKVYKASVEDNATIDFDDMIYWCATGRVEPLAFDFVVTDECLPYKTPVLLSDGTSMTIGEMVGSRFDGEVLTYNEFTGVQESKKVVGWHKIANQKQLYKVKVKWVKRIGTVNNTNFVVCTEDHKIYTSRGWVRADNLMIGDVVQVETSAKKSQAYKITSTGRDSLAMVMSGKNASGLMKSNHKNGSIVQRGGNGRGFTVPQSMLLEELGDGWVGEFAIKTSGWYRGCQYPPCYKVDIANPDKMVAVEVDGHSHNRPEIKSKDDKKRSLLESLGWTVIHVKNVDAVQKTKEVAKSILDVFDCPIEAIVTEIEPVNIPDFFVYDITVEDNHNFYANGILVHNCQDMNGARIAMLLRMLRNGGRSMVVGDRKQCVIDGTEISCYNTGGLEKTSCTGGGMIAENIVSGTNIMTAVGGSKVSSSVVQDVYRKKVVDKPVITITTKSGKTLTATSDHVIFSDFVNTKQTGKHYTYLMKKGDWYRVGRAAWYRSVPGKNKSGIIPGFKGRGNQEKADAMWILNISDSRSEAQYWEQYYSIVYGIPTWLFRVDGRGYDLSYDDNFINRLFTSVDTKSAGEKLLSDKGYDINRPHYSPKSTNKRRRRNFSIGLCSDSRHNPLHRYSVSGSDDEDKEKLLNVGLNARTIGGDRNGWRVEGITGDLGKIYDILDLVKSALGEVNVIESGVFGGHQSLRMFPMSQVLVGMNVYVVNDEGVVEYDEVVSRKDWNYTGFVNDFNISGTHNYVAGGIVVHNCIYSWAGASEGAMDILKKATNARELPLSITYRCPASHVKLAQELVPQIQARPNAPEGIIGHLKPWQLTNFLRDGDMVMCRTNAPLVRPAFDMLAQGKKAIIVGRDIGSNMVNLIDRIAKKNSISDTNSMLDELTKYIDMQVYRLEKTGKLGKAAMLRDQLETIEAIADGCPTVDSVNRKITDIFSDERDGVRFSSCHRSKGLEADRTFILRPELMPHPMAKSEQAMESEKNVKYVSLTRSKAEMYFVR